MFQEKEGQIMMKTSRKEIRSYLNGHNDLNEIYGKLSQNQGKLIEFSETLKPVAYSLGVYGLNAELFINDKGAFYVVPDRSVALFYFDK